MTFCFGGLIRRTSTGTGEPDREGLEDEPQGSLSGTTGSGKSIGRAFLDAYLKT